MQHDIPEITAVELKSRLDRGDALTIIDVREPHEWDIASLGHYGARLIPLGELPRRIREVDASRDVVVHCKAGGRSARALHQLREAGVKRVWNLHGGILAWAADVDPALPRY